MFFRSWLGGAHPTAAPGAQRLEALVIADARPWVCLPEVLHVKKSLCVM